MAPVKTAHRGNPCSTEINGKIAIESLTQTLFLLCPLSSPLTCRWYDSAWKYFQLWSSTWGTSSWGGTHCAHSPVGVTWRVAQASGARLGLVRQGPRGLCAGEGKRGCLLPAVGRPSLLPSTGRYRMAPEVFLAAAPSHPLLLFVPKKAVPQISTNTLMFVQSEGF